MIHFTIETERFSTHGSQLVKIIAAGPMIKARGQRLRRAIIIHDPGNALPYCITWEYWKSDQYDKYGHSFCAHGCYTTDFEKAMELYQKKIEQSIDDMKQIDTDFHNVVALERWRTKEGNLLNPSETVVPM